MRSSPQVLTPMRLCSDFVSTHRRLDVFRRPVYLAPSDLLVEPGKTEPDAG